MSDDEIYEAILRLAAAIHLTPPRWVSVRTRTPMPEDATPAALSSAVRVHALSLDRTPAQWLLLQETPTPELDLDDDDDRYSALPWEHIGGGGGGDLYRVFDRRLERTVVLKLLKKDKFDRKSFERFRQEATAAGRLNHQSIVPIFDTGSHHGRPFFTMQEVEGTTLAALLDGPRPPGVEQLVGHLCDVCNAIGHAHVRGYVHRDLKPSNIMITHANQVVIVDWGLVKRLGRNHTQPPGRVEPVSSPLTLEGMVLGTPAYMAPEQARTEDDR
ncbi:MAG: serine/threonine protein kinase, partial [Myxococcales bacterium]|nr:serine/threonine protein kinase [Myxococcales bacterium]